MTNIQSPLPTVNKNISHKRIIGLDAVKLIAMLSVVVSHSINVLIAYKQDLTMSTICHSLTAGGVPLFFMVSGYLLLGRKETTYKYVTHKIWAIVRYIAAACILYWAVMALIHWDYTQIKNCASEFVNTFMLRGPFTPFWFLWTMAVIYLLLPLIHRFYTRHTRAFAWAVALLGVFCILLFAAQFTGLRYSDRTLHQPLKMWKWMFFFALGGVLRAYPAPRLHWGRIAICAAVLNAAQRYFLEPLIHDTSNLAFAGSPISLLFYIAVFCWAIQRKWGGNYVLRTAGVLFMPVYTIHYIIIQQLTSLHDLGFGSYITYPLLICVLSVSASLIILHLPVKGGMARFFKL